MFEVHNFHFLAKVHDHYLFFFGLLTYYKSTAIDLTNDDQDKGKFGQISNCAFREGCVAPTLSAD